MPSFATLRAIGGGAKAAGQSLQELMTHRLAEQQLEVNRQEAQERQQTLENWRKAQEDQIRFNMDQAEKKRQQFLDYINNPNTTPEMKRAAEFVYYTGQSPSGELVGGLSPENKFGLEQRAADAKLQRDIILKREEAAAGGRTAGERAVPPPFAQHIAEIIDKYPNLDKALDNYDYKVRTGFFVDTFGENIDTNAGRNRLSTAHRQAHLAGAKEPGDIQKWVEGVAGNYMPEIPQWVKDLGKDKASGGTPAATPKPTPAAPTPPPGAPPGWHPPMSVVPGLRAIPEVPFSGGVEEMPPALSLPRTPRGTPSSGGPSGEEIWNLISGAGKPGEPELPSSATVYDLLNARAGRAPTKPGVTTSTPRVKPKKKPVRLRQRLQIEGYDVIPQ